MSGKNRTYGKPSIGLTTLPCKNYLVEKLPNIEAGCPNGKWPAWKKDNDLRIATWNVLNWDGWMEWRRIWASSVLGRGEVGHWIGMTGRKFWQQPGHKLGCRAMMMMKCLSISYISLKYFIIIVIETSLLSKNVSLSSFSNTFSISESSDLQVFF